MEALSGLTTGQLIALIGVMVALFGAVSAVLNGLVRAFMERKTNGTGNGAKLATLMTMAENFQQSHVELRESQGRIFRALQDQNHTLTMLLERMTTHFDSFQCLAGEVRRDRK